MKSIKSTLIVHKINISYINLVKQSQDILERKPDKGYPDAGSMV